MTSRLFVNDIASNIYSLKICWQIEDDTSIDNRMFLFLNLE